MNSDLPALFVGGRVRPCHRFAYPFSSPIASFGTASETGSEAIPMAPLKQRKRFTLDDGPRSEIREGGLKAILKKYGIHSSVHMRSPSEFERAPDGGPGEIAIYEAYLVTGFRGIVLGELHGLETIIHEVLYSYRFAPWRIVPGFYHLQPRDGAPLVEEPRRGIRSNSSFKNNWSGLYVFMKIQEPFHYPTFWRTVGESRFLHLFPLVVDLLILGFVFRCISSGIFSWGSGGEEDVDDSSALSWGALFDEQGGNITRLPASVLYDENQQAGTRRGRPFYAPPPRLTNMAPFGMGSGPFPPGNIIGDAPLAGIQQRLLNELFSLCNRVSDMAAQRDLLIQQVRASSRWELIKEWLERRTEHWDPSEEYRQYLFWSVEPTRLADASLRVGPESTAESRMFFGGFMDPRRLGSLEPLDLKMIGPHRSRRIESLLGTLGSLRKYK
ncbi:hypothetical protein Bca101_075286 [Brassica carinata]